MKHLVHFFSFFCMCMLVLWGCEKDTPPISQSRTVSAGITEITDSSAVCTLSIEPLEAVLKAGVIYAVDSLLQTNKSDVSTTDVSVYPLTLQLTGLQGGTTYYYKAYATDKSDSYVYGKVETFTTPASPALNVSLTQIEAGQAGGEYTFSIAGNLPWTIRSDQDWCTVQPASGTGDGEIAVSIKANATANSRTATLTVSGGSFSKEVTVQQANASPFIELSSSMIEAGVSGGTYKFNITGNQAWSITSSQTWCTVDAKSGSGNKEITVTVAANATQESRTGILTITAGSLTRQLTIQQKETASALDLSIPSIEAQVGGGTYTFNISSNQSWTIASNQTWCAVQPASGSGNKEISVAIPANTAATSRSAVLTVTAGSVSKQITVQQKGAASADLEVSVSLIEAEAAAGTYKFTAYSNQSWTIASSQTWCSVQPSSGSGNKEVSVSLGANSTSATRTAVLTLTAGDVSRQVIVQQKVASSTPTLEASVSLIEAEAAAGAYKFTVSSNQAWTLASSQTWCSVQPASGSGNKEISVSVAANSTTAARTAVLTLTAGDVSRQVTVQQKAPVATPTLEASVSLIEAAATAGTHKFTVISNQAWTLASSQTWCTVQPTSGSDNKEISVSVTANTSATSRTAILTLTAGNLSKQITVQQKEVTFTLDVSTASLEAEAEADSYSFNITSSAAWAIASDQTWCTVLPASGTGNQTIVVTVAANTSATARTATLTVTAGNLTKQVSIQQKAATIVDDNVFRNGVTPADAFGGGIGSRNNPYLISGGRQLKKLVDDVASGQSYANVYFKLTTDIEVTATDWAPIGYSDHYSYDRKPFSGFFDGDNYTIRGQLLASYYKTFGFFGLIFNGSVSNLNIAARTGNAYSGDSHTGAIAGRTESSEIKNCHVSGNVSDLISGNSFLGGIVGFIQQSNVSDCTVSGTVRGGENIGGIAGYAEGSMETAYKISNCTVSGRVEHSSENTFFLLVGGILGRSVYLMEINNCTVSESASIAVTTPSYCYVGGIVGSAYYRLHITGSTNHAGINAKSNTGRVGGISGDMEVECNMHTCLNTGNINTTFADMNDSSIGGLAGILSHNSFSYSCSTNSGLANGQAVNRLGSIGPSSGGEPISGDEPCPYGHTPR
jgi:hypothetical protein